MRLLILGGTTEASRLAARLAGDARVSALLSLAGRTREPVLPSIAVRIGGFGGVEGLTEFLRENAIAALVDATHPFAAQISAHAGEACSRLALPLAVLTRPPWVPEPGDRWTSVPDLPTAVAALGHAPRRVFITTGRLGLAAYRAAPQHDYLGRTIEPPAPGDCPPSYRAILARGPFTVEGEIDLMRAERIDVLVTKNSGAGASEAKMLAARALQLPVVVVERPLAPGGRVFTALGEVEHWIFGHASAP